MNDKLYSLNRVAQELVRTHISSYVWSYDGDGAMPTRPLRQYEMGDKFYREIQQITVRIADESEGHYTAWFSCLQVSEDEENWKVVPESVWTYEEICSRENIEYSKDEVEEITIENISDPTSIKADDCTMKLNIELEITPEAKDDDATNIIKLLTNISNQRGIHANWSITFTKN